MTRWILAVALASALPALADDKSKETKKPAPKAGVSVEDLLAQADQKTAAGDFEGAVTILKKAADQDATGGVSLRLGRVLEAKFDLDLAMDAYTAAAAKLAGPKKGEALGRLSSLEDLRGMPESIATADAAVAADAAGPWPKIALAKARARQGKGDEAVALAEAAAAAGGGAAASTALGVAQEARGDMAAAEKAYRVAIEAPEAKVAASVGLARVLRKTGRAAEAEPLLQQAIASAPGAIEAYKEMARVKMALNRPQEARADAATAAAMAEGDADAQRLVGEVTVAQAMADLAAGQVDMAIENLTALRDKEPNLVAARVGLARTLVAKRPPQTDAALVDLKRAAEIEPNNGDVQYQLGYVNHVVKGNAAAALPFYQKAVAADPGNVTYRTNLGAVLTATKDFDGAVAELNKVTASPGYNRPDAWIYLGQAHLGAKRYKDAIAALEKALAIAPNSDQANAFLGWCYFGLKDAANFKKYAGQAKALGYKEPTLLQYLGRVEAGEAIK
ncbi:MAG: tetratricopeptide repeat protein [Vicinamibacteria bacterium]